MTHLDYERAKFALEHPLKQRSRRYVGLAILFCLAGAVVAAAFIASGAVGHWPDWSVLAITALIYWWAISVALARSVIERPQIRIKSLNRRFTGQGADIRNCARDCGVEAL